MKLEEARTVNILNVERSMFVSLFSYQTGRFFGKALDLTLLVGAKTQTSEP